MLIFKYFLNENHVQSNLFKDHSDCMEVLHPSNKDECLSKQLVNISSNDGAVVSGNSFLYFCQFFIRKIAFGC